MVSVLSMLSSKASIKITISKLMKKEAIQLILEQLINGHLDYVNFQAVYKGDVMPFMSTCTYTKIRKGKFNFYAILEGNAAKIYI